jgi:hypothetical protein
MHVFSFMFLIITSVLFAITSLCAPLDAITLPHLHVHILASSCMCISLCHFGAKCFALSNVTVTVSWLITTTTTTTTTLLCFVYLYFISSYLSYLTVVTLINYSACYCVIG